jgi:hypothetical protein
MKVSTNSIAENTQHSYAYWIDDYIKSIAIIEGVPPAEPITLQSMQCYLAYLTGDRKLIYNSLLMVIASFLHKFCFDKLDDLTKSMEFKQLKSGLRRTMNEDKPPNTTEPIMPEHFGLMLQNDPSIIRKKLELFF